MNIMGHVTQNIAKSSGTSCTLENFIKVVPDVAGPGHRKGAYPVEFRAAQ